MSEIICIWANAKLQSAMHIKQASVATRVPTGHDRVRKTTVTSNASISSANAPGHEVESLCAIYG